MKKNSISKQIKAARMLLGWSQQDLVRATSLSEPTIARAESMSDIQSVNKSSLNLIIKTFEEQGIKFLDNIENKDCLGVVLLPDA